MQSFLTLDKAPSFSPQDFANWSDKDIQTTCTARSLSQLPEVATKYLNSKNRTFDSSFRSALLSVREQRASGTFYSCGTYVSNGWRTEPVQIAATVPKTATEPEKPATITFPSVEGVETIKMTPIPVFPGEKNRQGCEFIAPLIASLFHLKDGKVILAIELYRWVGALKHSGMHYDGFEKFSDVVSEVMNVGIAVLPVTTRNGLVGTRWYQYVKDQLNTCPYGDYLAIHTTFHRYVRRSGAEYDYLTARIPTNGASEKLKEHLKQFGPSGAHLVVAPMKMDHCPLLEFVEKKNSKGKNTLMTRAIAATVQLQTLLGEASRSVSLLTSTRGFSSMMSRMECDVTFLVSATLAALDKYYRVVVNISSTSMLDPLHNSFLTWTKTKSPDSTQYSLRFLVTIDDLPKIAVTYKPYCVLVRPKDHVFVWDQGAAISSKGEVKDKLKEATNLLADIKESSRYIIRTAVYGDLFSGIATSKEKANKETTKASNSSNTAKAHDDGHFVYEFGIGHGFQGIVSTEENLSLMAKQPMGNYYHKPLKYHKTEHSWYTYVESSCNLVLCSPFRPQVFASEICNVVTVDKTKFKIIRKPTGDDEFETLSGLSQIDVMQDSEFGDADEDDDEEYDTGDDGGDDDGGGDDADGDPPQSAQGDYFNDDDNDGGNEPVKKPPRTAVKKKKPDGGDGGRGGQQQHLLDLAVLENDQ